ncbi:hypothetical protein EVAR_68625_1 [Eumeta japonica]|uniref:Uncharacterized protein n=1 Tax=Eumeta variegata TaxID=151549 RepID=A0A4C2ABR5_EUMVA|nr:hypothetical protein EVAR_68625_1 [Eumeta japonica]
MEVVTSRLYFVRVVQSTNVRYQSTKVRCFTGLADPFSRCRKPVGCAAATLRAAFRFQFISVDRNAAKRTSPTVRALT